MRSEDIEGFGPAGTNSPQPEPPPDDIAIKLKINELLWMHGPGQLTLANAESRALRILSIVLEQP